mmetsp:Transcript_84971/g.140680  ORF Transcript_84971/g.140680 Transcript_84971/m.140680 type:complete len:215 (+) Transcript_84971:239-883(+)
MVDLMDKPANFTDLYSAALANERDRAKVPLVEVSEGGPILVESLVIVEYLHDLAADSSSEKALNTMQKANARLFTSLCQPKLGFINILKAEADSEEEAKATEELRAGLREMDSYLQQHADPSGPFFFGESFSVLAEAVLSPFVQRLVTVLPGLRPKVNPLTLMEEDGLSRLATWTQAVVKRESCVSTIPPAEDLVTGYSKLLERMKQAPAPASR